MRGKAVTELFRVARFARGAVQKTTLVVGGAIYAFLVLTGFPIAVHALYTGNLLAGSRVLGILGILLAATAGYLRLDALERQSNLDRGTEDQLLADTSSVVTETVERVYREYILGPRFHHVVYATLSIGVVFLGISYSPLV